jgi:histidine ammonia-lyase
MVLLDGSSLTLEALDQIAHHGERVGLAPAAASRVRASREVVDAHAAKGTAVYGVNTGFGALADVAIPADQLAQLQLNLLRSHAAGVGDPLPVPVVRALTALRANVLAKGFSGIRLETLEALIAMLNAGVHPRVPSRGSVGASGDLAPLAHLALVLVGEGETDEDVGRLFTKNVKRHPTSFGVQAIRRLPTCAHRFPLSSFSFPSFQRPRSALRSPRV